MGILSFTYNAAKKALRGKNVTPGQAIKKTQVGTKLAFKRGEQDKFVKHYFLPPFLKICVPFIPYIDATTRIQRFVNHEGRDEK